MPKALREVKSREDQEEAEPLAEDLEKELQRYEKRDFSSLISQVETEFQMGYWFMRPKLDEWALRLKLYNNQRRDKTAVGDPLMFTIHQTVLASLYSDRLNAEFTARKRADEHKEENWNAMARFDEDQMGKDIFDYEFDWDASWFGRGIAMFMDFDRDTLTPIPEVWDPMTFLRDPRATSVAGDRRGRGRLRFGGREIRLSQNDIKSAGVYFNTKGLKSDGNDISSLFDRNAQLRADAQGLGDVTKYNVKGENADFRALEWLTTWKGKPVLVTLANNRTKIIRYQVVEPGFNLIDRAIYPMAHDWDGVSIPDLTEDKQRARSIVQNGALRAIKAQQEPMYLFDTNKIKNKADLNFGFNKHIGIDGNPNNAVIVAPKDQVRQEVNWILDVLDGGAQRATATPDIQQGANSDQRRTATEQNLVAAKVDTRYSLSAKIFGWSEKRFWLQYIKLYKKHFTSKIDEKQIRTRGAMGSHWTSIKREDIVGEADFDVDIESKAVSDAKRLEKLQMFRAWFKDVYASMPQDVNLRYALRYEGKLSGFDSEIIDGVMAPNADELLAEQENITLSKGDKVDVNPTDDDIIHMEIHNKADDTPEKLAHMAAHKKAMALKKARPDLFPPKQAGQMAMPGAGDMEVARRSMSARPA